MSHLTRVVKKWRAPQAPIVPQVGPSPAPAAPVPACDPRGTKRKAVDPPGSGPHFQTDPLVGLASSRKIPHEAIMKDIEKHLRSGKA